MYVPSWPALQGSTKIAPDSFLLFIIYVLLFVLFCCTLTAATPTAEGAPTTVTAIIDGEPTEVRLINQPAAAGSTNVVRGIAVINGTETEVLLRPAPDGETAEVEVAAPAAEPAAAAAPQTATTSVTIDGQQKVAPILSSHDFFLWG